MGAFGPGQALPAPPPSFLASQGLQDQQAGIRQAPTPTAAPTHPPACFGFTRPWVWPILVALGTEAGAHTRPCCWSKAAAASRGPLAQGCCRIASQHPTEGSRACQSHALAVWHPSGGMTALCEHCKWPGVPGALGTCQAPPQLGSPGPGLPQLQPSLLHPQISHNQASAGEPAAEAKP